MRTALLTTTALSYPAVTGFMLLTTPATTMRLRLLSALELKETVGTIRIQVSTCIRLYRKYLPFLIVDMILKQKDRNLMLRHGMLSPNSKLLGGVSRAGTPADRPGSTLSVNSGQSYSSPIVIYRTLSNHIVVC